MSALVLVVDGITATGNPFNVTRGIGAASTLSVGNQSGIGAVVWQVRQMPDGATLTLGAVGNAPTFSVSAGDFNVPGMYVIECVPDGNVGAAAWIEVTATLIPIVTDVVTPGGGQAATLGNTATPNGGTGPANTAQYGWKKDVGADGVVSWIPIWR